MEFIFEIALQFLGEILLQILFEALAELGLHSLKDIWRKPLHPVFSTIGFALWGAIAGGISLLIFPHSPITNPLYRKLNLLITPVIAGAVMALVGRRRDGTGQSRSGLDRFGFAFMFAFTMAIVRFVWAR